jgi:hypothetical protein
MISKIASFQDSAVDRQVQEIVANQFDKKKTVTITFTAANTTTQADIGTYIDRFIVIDKSASITIWRVSSDNQFANFQASGAGTATIMVWKGEN